VNNYQWPSSYFLYNGDLTTPNPENPAQSKKPMSKTPPPKQ